FGDFVPVDLRQKVIRISAQRVVLVGFDDNAVFGLHAVLLRQCGEVRHGVLRVISVIRDQNQFAAFRQIGPDFGELFFGEVFGRRNNQQSAGVVGYTVGSQERQRLSGKILTRQSVQQGRRCDVGFSVSGQFV